MQNAMKHALVTPGRREAWSIEPVQVVSAMPEMRASKKGGEKYMAIRLMDTDGEVRPTVFHGRAIVLLAGKTVLKSIEGGSGFGRPAVVNFEPQGLRTVFSVRIYIYIFL